MLLALAPLAGFRLPVQTAHYGSNRLGVGRSRRAVRPSSAVTYGARSCLTAAHEAMLNEPSRSAANPAWPQGSGSALSSESHRLSDQTERLSAPVPANFAGGRTVRRNR